MNTKVCLLGLFLVLFSTIVECVQIACPKQVNAKEWETVTIECRYSKTPVANKYARKYFCEKKERGESCKDTIITNEDVFETKFLGRVFLTDNKDGIITIKINEVDRGDEGTYMVGIGTDKSRLKAVIGLAVTDGHTITMEPELIYAELRSTVKFRCKSEQSDSQEIFFCKTIKTGCKTIIDSLGNVDPAYAGRIAIKADDQNPGTSHITLVQVQAHDAACYSCGAGKTTYDLRINEGTNIPQSPVLLSPRRSGSLTANCNYDSKKKFTRKSWCRWNSGSCSLIMDTDGAVMEAYAGRVLIHDDPAAGLMQVVMNNISKEDEGWYWCVLSGETYEHICNKEVLISNVNYEGLSGSKIQQVVAGDSVQFPCTYPCKFRSYEFFWCKWTTQGCQTVISREENQNSPSVSCEPQDFMLSFEQVVSENNGVYWCGVKRAGKYVDSIAVHMVVKEAGAAVDPISTNNEQNFIPRQNGESKTDVIIVPSESKNVAVLASSLTICVALLVFLTVFLLRRRRRHHSDLISVGSYRTNISMTDLDNGIGRDNPGATQFQESCAGIPKDVPKEKEKKKETQEELDYSSFLTHEMNEQDVM